MVRGQEDDQGLSGGQADAQERVDVLALDVDIIIPAALENQITRDNADRVKARIVAEAANGPTTTDAEKILLKKNILILADIYLNAGGVTVSYFEWAKNISHMRYGLLQKRADAFQREQIVNATEAMTHTRFPASVRQGLLKGLGEEDLVRSGLEETMATGYQEITDILKKTQEGDRLPDRRRSSARSRKSVWPTCSSRVPLIQNVQLPETQICRAGSL
jgi:glutamate dehydrogenase (NAD(P)+)